MSRSIYDTKPVPRENRGFSLIELMVVVLIIGILAAVAYPSYQNSVIKTNRKDAMGVVQTVAQALEKHALQTNSYEDADNFPAQSPIEGTAIYTISVEADAISYTITAEPVADRANQDDGDITLTNTGIKERIVNGVTKKWSED